MIHHRKRICAQWVLTSLLVCLPVTGAFAAEGIIYKSTDAAGHIFYGDDPLPGAVKVEIVRIRSTADLGKDALATQHAALEQLAATTKRLQDDRKEREKTRLEAAERQREAEVQYYTTAPPLALNRPYYDEGGYPAYYPAGYYPPGYYGREYHQDVHYGANWGSSKWRIGVYYGGEHTNSHNPHGYGGHHRSGRDHGSQHGNDPLQPPLRQPSGHKAPGRFE